ncbi:hypothetical protein Fmac_028467 [Flemingia macrophylla]|uniref:Uncharacterized protein n=1 Tax=Flemingia macrophylla TaxID=520843 RepID=A0ABD1L7L4_9FABA
MSKFDQWLRFRSLETTPSSRLLPSVKLGLETWIPNKAQKAQSFEEMPSSVDFKAVWNLWSLENISGLQEELPRSSRGTITSADAGPITRARKKVLEEVIKNQLLTMRLKYASEETKGTHEGMYGTTCVWNVLFASKESRAVASDICV